MSQPNGGQPQQWGQPQNSGQQTWGQATSTGFNNAKASSGFDVKTVPWWQWLIVGGWLLYIITLSLPALTTPSELEQQCEQSQSQYGGSYDCSSSASGWNYGLHVFAFILATLAALAVIAYWFMKSQLSGLGFPFGFVTGGLAVLAGLLALIGFIVNLGDTGEWADAGIGTWLTLLPALMLLVGGVMEIMNAMKQPKTPASSAQWGQPAAAGQWGQPTTGAQPVQGGQWGSSPQTGGQPAQPQDQQWGQQNPQTGSQPGQQWGQNPPQGQQWGNPQG